ncbi:hypothetical protein HUU39_11365 [candidate division KSB1 bacterium]|nr:hypothetical protein [candidate division KSB1 bacterium]
MEIRAKLAQAEPDLLERRLDLVVSFYKISSLHQGKVKREYLQRALQILLELQRAGKLPPANAGWIAAIQQELAKGVISDQ